MKGLCVGNIPPNRNFPGLCLEVRKSNLHAVVLIICQDSPLAVRFTDFATAFPAGVQVAST